jgi:hypothetical protein
MNLASWRWCAALALALGIGSAPEARGDEATQPAASPQPVASPPPPVNVCEVLKSGGADASLKEECTSGDCVNEISACYGAIQETLPAPADRKGVLRSRRDYQNVRRWAGRNLPPELQKKATSGLRGQELELRDAIDENMRAAGLVEPFFGALVSGPVFQSVAKAPEQKNPGTAVLGTVVFESKHLGDRGTHSLHASVGGKVGYEPIFLMTLPKDAPEGTPVAASYSSGLVWNVGLNLGLPLGRVMAGEMTLYTRYGQSEPGPGEIADEKGELAHIAVPSDAGAGLARDFWDVGVKTVLFQSRLDQNLAHERGYLFPAASVHFGMRWDRRFARDPALAAFTSPERRLYFGFRINALHVFKDATDGSPYELTFGVEREWALRKGGLPSGTRIVLAGSVNLLQALGASKPKTPDDAPGEGPGAGKRSEDDGPPKPAEKKPGR